jgi:hypothetical protein
MAPTTQPESYTAAIAAELGWHADLIGWRGQCPRCRAEPAWLWAERTGRAPDSWSCPYCGAGGSVFGLHHIAALHGQAA